MTDFEEIYATYFDSVYQYVLSLCRDVHTAEEVTQESFCKAMTHLDRFDGRCRLYVWLCQIAKNCYYASQRKEKRTVPLADISETADGGASPEELVSAREDIRRVRAALHTLSEPYREVFMWRVFAELSYKQIG